MHSRRAGDSNSHYNQQVFSVSMSIVVSSLKTVDCVFMSVYMIAFLNGIVHYGRDWAVGAETHRQISSLRSMSAK